jgi:hypothetical protein
MKSQLAFVMDRMLAGNSITTLDAFYDRHITRLGSRVYDLRKLGVPVTTELIHFKEEGRYRRYGRYSIKPEHRKKALQIWGQYGVGKVAASPTTKGTSGNTPTGKQDAL